VPKRRSLFIAGVVALSLSCGAMLELDRTGAYALYGLKIGAAVGLVVIVSQFLTDKEHHTKTVWRDALTGRVVRESGWRFSSFSSPQQRGSVTPGLVGCALASPLVSLVVGIMVASFANVGSRFIGSPPHYADPVFAGLALSAPSESNRVVNSGGFSLIAPAGWRVNNTEDGLFATPVTAKYRVEFSVRRCSWTNPASVVTSFLGAAARTSWQPGRPSAHNDRYGDIVGSLRQELAINRDTTWYCVAFEAPNYIGKRGPLRSAPVPIVDQYLRTFRFVPVRPTQ
jgi:hypothetical protein